MTVCVILLKTSKTRNTDTTTLTYLPILSQGLSLSLPLVSERQLLFIFVLVHYAVMMVLNHAIVVVVSVLVVLYLNTSIPYQ